MHIASCCFALSFTSIHLGRKGILCGLWEANRTRQSLTVDSYARVMWLSFSIRGSINIWKQVLQQYFRVKCVGIS